MDDIEKLLQTSGLSCEELLKKLEIYKLQQQNSKNVPKENDSSSIDKNESTKKFSNGESAEKDKTEESVTEKIEYNVNGEECKEKTADGQIDKNELVEITQEIGNTNPQEESFVVKNNAENEKEKEEFLQNGEYHEGNEDQKDQKEEMSSKETDDSSKKNEELVNNIDDCDNIEGKVLGQVDENVSTYQPNNTEESCNEKDNCLDSNKSSSVENYSTHSNVEKETLIENKLSSSTDESVCQSNHKSELKNNIASSTVEEDNENLADSNQNENENNGQSIEDLRNVLKLQLSSLRNKKNTSIISNFKQPVQHLKKHKPKISTTSFSLDAPLKKNSNCEDLISLADDTNFLILDVCGGVDLDKPEEPKKNLIDTIKDNVLQETASTKESEENENINVTKDTELLTAHNYPPVKKILIQGPYDNVDTTDIGKVERKSDVSPFVSDKLEDFLSEGSQLKISYAIPKLGAEEGLMETTKKSPYDDNVHKASNVAMKKIAPKKVIKAKTLAEMRRNLAKMKLDLKYLEDKNALDKESEKKPHLKLQNRHTATFLQRNCYIFYNDKKIWLTGQNDDACLGSIPKEQIKIELSNSEKNTTTNPIQGTRRLSILSTPSKCEKTNRTRYKPGPLSKKAELEREVDGWKTEVLPLPQVFLEVVPEINKPISNDILHLLPVFDNVIISKERADFALSVLKSDSKPEPFKFPVKYKNNQEKFVVRRRVTTPKFTGGSLISEEDSEIKEQVTTVLDNILNYVEIKELEHTLIKDDDTVFDTENIDKNLENKVKKTVKRKRRIEIELERLNCKVINVETEKEDSGNCDKLYCKMGCVCKSLIGKKLFPNHCGLIECMFECKCPPSNKDTALSEYTVNHLNDQATKNLAKVEKEFTTTIINTGSDMIVVGGKNKSKRISKAPKKYGEYMFDVEDIIESHEKPLEALIVGVKKCTIDLTKLDLKNLVPYCLLHGGHYCSCNLKGGPIFRQKSSLKSLPENKSHNISTNKKKIKEVKQIKEDEDITEEKDNEMNLLNNPKIVNQLVEEILPPLKGKVPEKKQKMNVVKKFVRISKENYQVVAIRKNSSKIRKNNLLNKKRKTSLLNSHGSKTKESLKRQKPSQELKFEEILLEDDNIKDVDVAINQDDPLTLVQDNSSVSETIIEIENVEEDSNKIGDVQLHQHQQQINVEVPKMVPVRKINKRKQSFHTIREDFALQRRKKVKVQSEPSTTTIIPAISNMNINNTTNISKTDDSTSDKRETVFEGEIQVPLNENKEILKILLAKNIKVEHCTILPWEMLIKGFNSGAIQIWTNIKRTSSLLCNKAGVECPKNYFSIRESVAKSGIIKWILSNTLPEVYTPSTTYIILIPANNHFVIMGFCEKNKSKGIKQVISKVKSVDSNFPANKVTHKDMNNKMCILYVTMATYGESLHKGSHFPSIKLPLPKVAPIYKWRMIYLKSDFTYLLFSKSKYSIKYTDLMEVAIMAKNINKTITLKNARFTKHYLHDSFGIYFVPTYQDRLFIGPCTSSEEQGIETLRYMHGLLIDTNVFDKIRGNSISVEPIWVTLVPQKTTTNKEVIDISLDDETKIEDVPPIIPLDEPNVSNSSSSSETDIDITEHLLTPPFVKIIDANEMKQKTPNCILLCNIPNLGYFEAFETASRTIEVFWPDKSKGYKFHDLNFAKLSLAQYLTTLLYTVPIAFKIDFVVLSITNQKHYDVINMKYLTTPNVYFCGDFGICDQSSFPSRILQRYSVPSVDLLINPTTRKENHVKRMVDLFSMFLMSQAERLKYTNVDSILDWASSEIYIMRRLSTNYETEKLDLQYLYRFNWLRIKTLLLSMPLPQRKACNEALMKTLKKHNIGKKVNKSLPNSPSSTITKAAPVKQNLVVTETIEIKDSDDEQEEDNLKPDTIQKLANVGTIMEPIFTPITKSGIIQPGQSLLKSKVISPNESSKNVQT